MKEAKKEARKKKIEKIRNRKFEDKIPPPPKLKRSKAIDMKQEISTSVNKKLEDKIEISEKSIKELNELFKDISNQKDLTEVELNDMKDEINNKQKYIEDINKKLEETNKKLTDEELKSKRRK